METKQYSITEICEIKSGKRIPLGLDFVTYKTNHPYIRARDIKNGTINTDDLIYLDDFTFHKIKKYVINKNDIAITIVGASIGDVGYALQSVDGYNLTENAVRLTNFNEKADSKYIYYLLTQEQYKEFMQTIAGGAAQPKLGIYKIQRIKVQLPPLPKQQKIASILSAYDNLIQNYKKQIEDLQTTASELYKEWFVRFRFPGYKTTQFENGIPVGWRIDTVNKTFNIYDTDRIPLSSLDRDNMEKLYPYYGAAELMDYVDNYLFDGIYLLMGEDGSVITPEGTPVLQYVWGKFWVNNHAHVLKGKGVYSTEFLHLMFNQMDITGIVTGAAQPKISQGRLFKKKVVLPDDKTVSKFNEIIQHLYSKIRLLNTQITNLTQQRDLLLPRLMSGKLEVE